MDQLKRKRSQQQSDTFSKKLKLQNQQQNQIYKYIEKPYIKDSYQIEWKHILKFIQKINRLLINCKLNDQTTKNMELIMVPYEKYKLFYNSCSQTEQKNWLDLTSYYLTKYDIPLCYFILIEKQPVRRIRSMILSYFFENKKINKIGYGLHSKTFNNFENKGYNTFLRSIFILSSQYLFINNNQIDFMGSNAQNLISETLWTTKFLFLKVPDYLIDNSNDLCRIIFYYPDDPFLNKTQIFQLQKRNHYQHNQNLQKYFNINDLRNLIFDKTLEILTQELIKRSNDARINHLILKTISVFNKNDEKIIKIIKKGIFFSYYLRSIIVFNSNKIDEDVLYYFFYILFPKIALKENWIEGENWNYINKDEGINIDSILNYQLTKNKLILKMFGSKNSNFTVVGLKTDEIINNAKKVLIEYLKRRIGKCTLQQFKRQQIYFV